MNLLNQLLLAELAVTRLEAKLLRAVPAQLRAHVELKLTPDGEAKAGPTLAAQLIVEGQEEGQSEPAFRAVIAVRAVYRLQDDVAFSRSDFTKYHHTLTRQLYPLLVSRLRPLLAELGIPAMPLPPDIAPKRNEPERPSLH